MPIGPEKLLSRKEKTYLPFTKFVIKHDGNLCRTLTCIPVTSSCILTLVFTCELLTLCVPEQFITIFIYLFFLLLKLVAVIFQEKIYRMLVLISIYHKTNNDIYLRLCWRQP